jgi:hypothetical protein
MILKAEGRKNFKNNTCYGYFLAFDWSKKVAQNNARIYF